MNLIYLYISIHIHIHVYTHTHTHTHIYIYIYIYIYTGTHAGVGNDNLLHICAWRIPMDRRACWILSMGSQRVWTWLRDWTHTYTHAYLHLRAISYKSGSQMFPFLSFPSFPHSFALSTLLPSSLLSFFFCCISNIFSIESGTRGLKKGKREISALENRRLKV